MGLGGGGFCGANRLPRVGCSGYSDELRLRGSEFNPCSVKETHKRGVGGGGIELVKLLLTYLTYLETPQLDGI